MAGAGTAVAELALRGPCPPGGPARPHPPRLEGLQFGSGKPRSCFKSGLQNSLRINTKTSAFSMEPIPEQPSSPEGLRFGNAVRSASYSGCRLSSYPSHVSRFIELTALFYRVLNPLCSSRRGKERCKHQVTRNFFGFECLNASGFQPHPLAAATWHVLGNRARARARTLASSTHDARQRTTAHDSHAGE